MPLYSHRYHEAQKSRLVVLVRAVLLPSEKAAGASNLEKYSSIKPFERTIHAMHAMIHGQMVDDKG